MILLLLMKITLILIGLTALWDPPAGSNDIFWGIIILYISTWFKFTWD